MSHEKRRSTNRSKPKNPFPTPKMTDKEMRDFTDGALRLDLYRKGVAAGEKRLAIALRRWISKQDECDVLDILEWLSKRQKRKR